jgi:hypothetical protein
MAEVGDVGDVLGYALRTGLLLCFKRFIVFVFVVCGLLLGLLVVNRVCPG